MSAGSIVAQIRISSVSAETSHKSIDPGVRTSACLPAAVAAELVRQANDAESPLRAGACVLSPMYHHRQRPTAAATPHSTAHCRAALSPSRARNSPVRARLDHSQLILTFHGGRPFRRTQATAHPRQSSVPSPHAEAMSSASSEDEMASPVVDPAAIQVRRLPPTQSHPFRSPEAPTRPAAAMFMP